MAGPVTSDTQSPILRAPTGELIDGRRLLAESVGFGRALRAAGLPIDLAAAIDFARALELDGVDIGRKAVVRDTGAALFVRRRDDREVYDRVFEQFWRRRGRKLPSTRLQGTTPDVEREQGEEGSAVDEADGEGHEASMTELATLGIQVATDADEGGEIEGTTISPPSSASVATWMPSVASSVIVDSRPSPSASSPAEPSSPCSRSTSGDVPWSRVDGSFRPRRRQNCSNTRS